jgi:hypothetical protein
MCAVGEGWAIRGEHRANLNIKNSFSDALSIIAPDSKHVQDTVANASIENVNIPDYGIGAKHRHSLWIRYDAYGSVTISNSKSAEYKNDSPNLLLIEEKHRLATFCSDR